MKKYAVLVAYDGTNYYGWQMQKELPSVTQKLQSSFLKVFGQSINIIGASRTDAGVHALGQIAYFTSDLVITPEKLCVAWNRVLPDDIVIKKVSVASDTFHPFYNVVKKVYHYHLFLNPPSPLHHRYGWYCARQINYEKLYQALQVFVGTHDFTLFCASDTPHPDKVRTVDSITIEYRSDLDALRIVVTAPKFLRYMIRRMVGTAVRVASSYRELSSLQDALYKKNVENLIFTAPAQGLTLYEIVYKEDI